MALSGLNRQNCIDFFSIVVFTIFFVMEQKLVLKFETLKKNCFYFLEYFFPCQKIETEKILPKMIDSNFYIGVIFNSNPFFNKIRKTFQMIL